MNLLINSLHLILIIYFILVCAFIIPKIFKNAVLSKSDKLLWTLLVLCFPFLGILAYTLFYKK
jgi:hypothetical protein